MLKRLRDYFERALFLVIAVILFWALLFENVTISPLMLVVIVLITIGAFGIALNIEKLQWCFVLFQWLIMILMVLQFIFAILHWIFGTSYSVVDWL